MGLKPRSKLGAARFRAVLARYVDEIWKLESRAQLDRLLETIDLCPDAKALWALMTTEHLQYTTMTADGGLDGATTERIFAHVAAWAPRERAAGLGIVGLLATLSLSHTLDAGALATVKVAELETLDAHISAIRRWCRDSNDDLRDAAIMLLCRTPSAGGASDVRMLRTILADTRSVSTRAAAALAIGILTHRDASELGAAPPTQAMLTENLSSSSVLLACASATALALIRGRICEQTAPHLVASFGVDAPLPEVWGVYDDERTVGGLARAAMLRLPGPGRLLNALLERALPAAEQDLLMRIGFGCEAVNMDNRGSAPDYQLRYSEVPPGGIARDELEDHQRHILTLSIERRTTWHRFPPLGFWDLAAEVPDYLAGEKPRWRPVEVVDLDGTKRRWHIPLVWRRYVFGPAVERVRAVEAMVGALPAPTLLNVILDWKARRVIERSQPNRADRARDKQLFAATINSLRARGYDVRADICGKIANPRLRLTYEPAALGVCLQLLCTLDGVKTPADTRSNEVLHAASEVFGGR